MDLLNDTFPDLVTEPKKHDLIQNAIKKQIELNEFIYHKSWVLKIIQIYESELVRHGNMLIGPVGAGKSTALQILADASSDCDPRGIKRI
jgi:dynein heavy chain